MAIIKQKKLTSKSAVTIPKDLRYQMGFTGSMAVDLIAQDDGILVRKHVPTCHYCGSIEDVKVLMGDEVCASCAEKLAKEVAEKYAG